LGISDRDPFTLSASSHSLDNLSIFSLKSRLPSYLRFLCQNFLSCDLRMATLYDQPSLISPLHPQGRVRHQIESQSRPLPLQPIQAQQSHHTIMPLTVPPISPGGKPGSRVMCCANILLRPQKTCDHLNICEQSDNTESDRPILEEFRNYCAGQKPDHVEDSSYPIPWEEYSYIYGVAHFESRKAKACTAVNIYAVSNLNGPEFVQIPQDAYLEVVGRSMAEKMTTECLVRQSGGLEYSCKRHLDTVYTTYLCKYQEQLVPKRPIAMPRKVLMAPPRKPPMMVAKAITNYPSLQPPISTTKPRTPSNPPTKLNITSMAKGTKRKTIEPSPLSTVETADDGIRMKMCSKHKKLFPESDFDERLPGVLYGHCRRCQEKRIK
jgi:hypothetical protein